MPTQSGNAVIQLTDKAGLLAQSPAPSCLVTPTELTYAFTSQAGRTVINQVSVSGVAWGASSVNLLLEHHSIPSTRAQAAVFNSHEWTASLDLAASPLPYGAVARLMADLSSGACNAHAEQTIVLAAVSDAEALLRPAMGCPSGFEEDRNRMVGGFADRFIASRSYVPFICSFWEWPTVDRQRLVDMMARVGVAREAAALVLQDATREAIRQGRNLQAQIESSGALGASKADILKVLQKAFAPLADKINPRSQKKDTPRFNTIEAAGGVTLARPHPGAQKDKDSPLSAVIAHGGFQGLVLNANGMGFLIASGIYHYVNLGWLGVLYYDRLRLRPSGLFAGEQVFSLALAPGEEATFTQKSETKKSRSFEDVTDRTLEQELEFKSVWSTEFSQEDTMSNENKFGFQGGLPTDAEMKAGVNAENAYKISETNKRKLSQEITSRFSNKAKLEHKTTFKIETDTTEEVTAKRVVHNYNPSRALTLNYYKLYQKYRVVLERYDAKLCVSHCLDDPSKDLRDQLIAEVAKYNQPPDATRVNCPSPDSVPHREGPLDFPADIISEGQRYAQPKFTLQMPPGHVLVQCQPPHLTKWTWKYEDRDQIDATTEEQFSQQGGEALGWFVGKAPIAGAGGPQSLECLFRVPIHNGWFGRPWHTVDISVELEWTSAPDDAHKAAAEACVLEATGQTRDSFSADRVMALVERLKGRKMDLLSKRLLETQLLKDYTDQQIDPPCDIVEDVRRWFDWEEMTAEYQPWWMTATGVRNYMALREALDQLPAEVKGNISVDALFLASYARVYLPIHPGFEKDVIATWAQLDDAARADMDKCVQDFIDWRVRQLGPIERPLPTYLEVTQIGPPVGTPTGATNWENDWEKPRRKFIVMEDWAESLPTDGVHVEPQLSACGSTDEIRTSSLVADLRGAGAAGGSGPP